MKQRFVRMLYGLPIYEVRSGFIARVKAENERINEARAWLVSQGYEELVDFDESTVINAGDVEYLPDGRVLIRAQKKSWALSAETWAQRQSEAMAQAKQREASSVEPVSANKKPLVCSALIDGQLCGGTLIRAAVCPRCALGKSCVTSTMT